MVAVAVRVGVALGFGVDEAVVVGDSITVVGVRVMVALGFGVDEPVVVGDSITDVEGIPVGVALGVKVVLAAPSRRYTPPLKSTT